MTKRVIKVHLGMAMGAAWRKNLPWVLAGVSEAPRPPRGFVVGWGG